MDLATQGSQEAKTGDQPVDSIGLLIGASILGALLLCTILWMFWPNLIGLSGSNLSQSVRLAIPALVAFAGGFALGLSAPQSAIRAAILMAALPLFAATVLGVMSAMRPIHLFVVLVLAFAYLAATIVGAMAGRGFARLRSKDSSPDRQP